ncbi:hypothetical protein CR513_10798, partial [Mucuna pruriens]
MKSEERQEAWQSKLKKTNIGYSVIVRVHLGKNSTFHSRSKHIDVRYHWIRDTLDAKLLELAKVHTDDNGADIMTKWIDFFGLDDHMTAQLLLGENVVC